MRYVCEYASEAVLYHVYIKKFCTPNFSAMKAVWHLFINMLIVNKITFVVVCVRRWNW